MKLQDAQLLRLCTAMQAAKRSKRFKITHIASQAEIDQSQASRILRGEFRTLSRSVMQICNILGIDAEVVTTGEGQTAKEAIKGGSQNIVVNGALSLWDGTPEDAQALARLFSHLEQMRLSRKKSRRETVRTTR